MSTSRNALIGLAVRLASAPCTGGEIADGNCLCIPCDARRVLQSVRSAPGCTVPDKAWLRELAERAAKGTWILATSNSWRRFITEHHDIVCVPVTHPVDRHPDLHITQETAEYILAAQPKNILALLDRLEELEDQLDAAPAELKYAKPPCQECGAMTKEEAETKCICSGDKDDCHGCHLWLD